MTRRILVFPCGSEIGLEIHRSMRYSRHFDLVGGSSVDDHGKFVFDEYIGGLPYHNSPDFPSAIRKLVQTHRIDAIYPAMDSVAKTLTGLSEQIGVKVIGSSSRATAICSSKTATYDALREWIPVPKCHVDPDSISDFPVFIKPDQGYGSRNTALAENSQSVRIILANSRSSDMVVSEYLPGQEWTVDCFSDRHGQLRFCASRTRARISNGISVNTRPSSENAGEFRRWAERIQEVMQFRGAWFFQAKNDAAARPKLLEVAARLGGSSGLFRCQGVNFALLSAFDAFDMEVDIHPNTYSLEMDRALDNRYRIAITYNHVFVDLDDCMIIRNQVNLPLLCLLHKAVAEGKRVSLITRHASDPMTTLRSHRVGEIFDRVIHIEDQDDRKSNYIDDPDSIFIDDSHVERRDVAAKHGIPVFSPDMIEALL